MNKEIDKSLQFTEEETEELSRSTVTIQAIESPWAWCEMCGEFPATSKEC